MNQAQSLLFFSPPILTEEHASHSTSIRLHFPQNYAQIKNKLTYVFVYLSSIENSIRNFFLNRYNIVETDTAIVAFESMFIVDIQKLLLDDRHQKYKTHPKNIMETLEWIWYYSKKEQQFNAINDNVYTVNIHNQNKNIFQII